MKILLFMLWSHVLAQEDTMLYQHPGVLTSRNCSDVEYPYLITIVRNDSMLCSGSLIEKRWVLTSGSCCETLELLELKMLTVQGGQSEWMGSAEQKSAIQDVFIHADFSMKPIKNDICLVKLKDDMRWTDQVKLSETVQPEEYALLMEYQLCNKTTVIGFGKQMPSKVLSEPVPSKHYLNQVQCATLSVASPNNCQGVLPKNISNSTLCGVNANKTGIGVCFPNFGIPMYCRGLQIGIGSAFLGCQLDYPSVFSRIDVHNEYIQDVMGTDSQVGKNSVSLFDVTTYMGFSVLYAIYYYCLNIISIN